MKRYIPVSRVEGTASRQAHCDLPEGTYEREMSKEGFFGPAAFSHHRHPPTGWTESTGPLRPRAFDLAKLPTQGQGPWSAAEVLVNGHCRIRYWRLPGSMAKISWSSGRPRRSRIAARSGSMGSTSASGWPT